MASTESKVMQDAMSKRDAELKSYQSSIDAEDRRRQAAMETISTHGGVLRSLQRELSQYEAIENSEDSANAKAKLRLENERFYNEKLQEDLDSLNGIINFV